MTEHQSHLIVGASTASWSFSRLSQICHGLWIMYWLVPHRWFVLFMSWKINTSTTIGINPMLHAVEWICAQAVTSVRMHLECLIITASRLSLQRGIIDHVLWLQANRGSMSEAVYICHSIWPTMGILCYHNQRPLTQPPWSSAPWLSMADHLPLRYTLGMMHSECGRLSVAKSEPLHTYLGERG
jgi:hypothetical protein